MGDCQVFPLQTHISLFENNQQSLEWHLDPVNIPIVFFILTDLFLHLLWKLRSPFHPASRYHWHKSASWKTQAEPHAKREHPLVRALRFNFSGSGCPSRMKRASMYSVLSTVLLMGRPKMRPNPSNWGAFNVMKKYFQFKVTSEVTCERGRKFYRWDLLPPPPPPTASSSLSLDID